MDKGFFLNAESYQELVYVAITRGRDANRVYTVVSRDELGEIKDDRLSDVRSALRQSRAQRAAIDHTQALDRSSYGAEVHCPKTTYWCAVWSEKPEATELP